MLTISLAVGRLLDELLVVEDAERSCSTTASTASAFRRPFRPDPVRLRASVTGVEERASGLQGHGRPDRGARGSQKPCCVAEEILLYR